MYVRPILFFADKLPPLIGGVEVHAQYFMNYFTKHPFFPLIGVITKSKKGNDVLLANNTAIELDELPKLFNPAIIFFNSGRWIEKIVKLRNLFPCATFLYRTGGNEIVQARLEQQNIPDHKQRQKYWVSNLNSAIDLMITNSDFTENRLKILGVTCSFAKCVGGVNADALKSYLCVDKNKSSLQLFSAARFVPYKNYSLLIAVTKELISRGNNIHLRLAGDGPLLEETKELVSTYGLKEHVEFLGAINNELVCEEIAKADAYIQFSSDYLTKVPGGEYIHTEGMGRSILEALSAGTFVIAGQCGALSEIVHEDRGVLINLNNPLEVSNAIEKALLKLPVELSKTDIYSWSNLFHRYENLMINIIQ